MDYYINNIDILRKYSDKKAICDQIDIFNSDYVAEAIIKMDPAYITAWKNKFSDGVDGRIFFLVGVADGSVIEALLEISDTYNIVVYEPEYKAFLGAMHNCDLRKILSSDRVLWCIEGVTGVRIENIVDVNINYFTYTKVQVGLMSSTPEHKAAYERFTKLLKNQINKVASQKNANEALAIVARQNFMKNLSKIIRGRTLNQLIDTIKNCNYSEIPAIIVSAGPSLDKNINELHRAKGKAFIVVVDTALKAALRAGITPDMTICIDPRKEVIFFNDERVKNVPAVFAMQIPSQVVNDHRGAEFYESNEERDTLNDFHKKFYGKLYEELDTGGSVANSAFSLLIKMGFKNIILIGQDLAFTDGKGHTKDAYDDENKNQADAKNANLIHCEVDGIYGGKVKTEIRMKQYIDWFENKIAYTPNINVIDATEGGALIHGTVVMTLKDAINTYCKDEIVNWEQIINAIPPRYCEEQYNEIKEYFLNIGELMTSIQLQLENGIKKYQELGPAINRGDGATAQKLMNEIGLINQYIDDNSIMTYVKYYAMDIENSIVDDMNTTNMSDVDIAINDGIKLMDSYIKAIDLFMQDTVYYMDSI